MRETRSLVRPPCMIGLVALLLGLMATPAAAGMDRATRLRVMSQVVKLRVLVKRGGRYVQVGHGSGSIISADGLILTNNHVVQNTKTGQLFDAIAIAPNKGFDQAPASVCMAWPRRAIRHAKLDLALIKCEVDMQGRPLSKRFAWPTVALGDSSTLVPGDELYIVGFPNVGGATITFTSGKVSGFLADARVGKGRVWIKTDALISGGVSGGAAFDETGKLVGVPTAYRRGSRGHTNIGLVRVIQKAKPMVALARKNPWNKLPRLAKVMPKPAEEGPRFRYPPTAPPNARPLPRRLPPMPGYPQAPQGNGADGTMREVPDRAHPRAGAPQRDRPPRQEPRVLPRPGSGYSALAGRVVDVSTSRPVRGAVVVVLKPGVNVFRVTVRALRTQVSTAGVADDRGFFLSKRPVRQGNKHGLIVVAKGYQPLRLNNAITIFRGGPPALNVGLIKLQPLGRRRPPPRRLPQFSEEMGE